MRISLLVFHCLLPFLLKAQLWEVEKAELICSHPPFNSCHASTLLETKNGGLLFAWFGGTAEGKEDVSIWLCRYESGKYGEPVKLAEGITSDGLCYPTWNPVLFRERISGTVYLFYKVGPNPREWWGMYIRSADEGKTWSAPVRLPPHILGPIKNKPAQLGNGDILFPSSTEAANGRWQAHIEKTDKDLKAFSIIPVDSNSALDVIQPSIVTYPDKRLQVLCRSKQGAVASAWSPDNGNTWTALQKTSLLNPNAGTDAIALATGSHTGADKAFIVYNPDLPGKEWWEGRTKLRAAVSPDGLNWKDIALLEDQPKGEFSYPSVIQTRDGKLHITYTYDRKNIKHVVMAYK
ncbi:MAG: exo-alpha-sialidase [Flavihumibacter sp.]